jgi:deoxyribonuclease-4
MSVAGGVSNAVARAELHGCESLQIFTKNASQWRGKPLDEDEVRRFRTAVARTGLGPVVSHASYLINLATADPDLRAKSIDAMADEVSRASLLGLTGVVVHPGTCTSGREEDACVLVARALDDVRKATKAEGVKVLLEHTAGQGRTIGYRFEHLRMILDACRDSSWIGVCLDTCHLIAAGYDLVSEAGYYETFAAFEREVGFDRLAVVHANDSKRPCGSRVDRHEHIGQGCLGLEPFRRLFRDTRFHGRGLLIETAKTESTGKPGIVRWDPLDQQNLDALRQLRAEACARMS